MRAPAEPGPAKAPMPQATDITAQTETRSPRWKRLPTTAIMMV